MATERRGFTLVEVLVVVAIIGILTAVLIPAIIRARQAAVRSACLSNLHQLATALNAYGNDHGGSLPPAYEHDGTDVVKPFRLTARGEVFVKTSGGELALLFRWPAEYTEVQGLRGLPYLPSAHAMSALARRCPAPPTARRGA